MDGFILFIIFVFVIFSIIKKFSKNPGKTPGENPFAAIVKAFQNAGKQYSQNTENETAGDRVYEAKTYNIKNNKEIMNKVKNKVLWVIGVIVVVIIFLNIFIVIPVGTTGVRSLFGKVKDKEFSSGLHIINPLEHVERMSIRTEEYTMSIVQGEGQRVGADQISALTNEGLSVDLDITVFYHLLEDKASDVYKDLGLNFQEKIIRPEIRSAIRGVIARYNAKDVYSEKRAEVSAEIHENMVETIEPRGIAIEQVLLRNVTLPQKLSSSIQEKLQAEQEAQRYDFVLQREEKEAERKRVEAAGQRDSQTIINQSLTPKYLEYLYIKELKDREGTIYVPIGNNGLPLFRSVE